MGRVSVRILAAMLLISAACRDRPAADQPGPAEDAAVLAVDSAFGAALNAGNLEAIGRTYDEDALLLPPAALPVRGREAIQGFWGGLLGTYDVHLTFGVDRFEIRDARSWWVTITSRPGQSRRRFRLWPPRMASSSRCSSASPTGAGAIWWTCSAPTHLPGRAVPSAGRTCYTSGASGPKGAGA